MALMNEYFLGHRCFLSRLLNPSLGRQDTVYVIEFVFRNKYLLLYADYVCMHRYCYYLESQGKEKEILNITKTRLKLSSMQIPKGIQVFPFSD